MPFRALPRRGSHGLARLAAGFQANRYRRGDESALGGERQGASDRVQRGARRNSLYGSSKTIRRAASWTDILGQQKEIPERHPRLPRSDPKHKNRQWFSRTVLQGLFGPEPDARCPEFRDRLEELQA